MNWIISRLKEASTWRVIAVLAGVIGYQISPEMQEAIAYAVGGAIGLIEIIRKENKAATPEQVKEAVKEVTCEDTPGESKQTIISPALSEQEREASHMDN